MGVFDDLEEQTSQGRTVGDGPTGGDEDDSSSYIDDLDLPDPPSKGQQAPPPPSEPPADDVYDVADKPEEPKTRREKRQERGGILEELRAAKERERQQAERIARLEGAMASQQQGRQQAPEGDPYGEQIRSLREESRRIHQQAEAMQGAGKLDADTKKRMEDRIYEIDDEISQAQFRRNASANSNQVSPQAQQASQLANALANRHPELAGPNADPQAARWARARFDMLQAEKPSQSTVEYWQAIDMVAAEAKERFGFAPSQSAQHRASARSTRRGAPPPERPGAIRMTDQRKSLADHLYGHIENPRERYSKFAKEHGPGILAEEKARRGR